MEDLHDRGYLGYEPLATGEHIGMDLEQNKDKSSLRVK